MNNKEIKLDPTKEGESWLSSKSLSYKLILESKRKSILMISGWIRIIDVEYRLNIPSNVTRLIHKFYQDPNREYDKTYKYYG